MEGRLSTSLQERINSLDISRPYVWRLKLSETDYKELKGYLEDVVGKCGVSALAQVNYAIPTIAYMAEWYKREYRSGNKNTLIEGLDLETLWNNSGISKKVFLYRDDSGSQRWLYSIYVLGGLAIHHELNRNDKLRFLKGLCRIYHGESYTLENLVDGSRAAAFRESIVRQHSLYEYMREILNGQMPFHPDDIGDEYSETNLFISTIKAANDEILKSKFRFEWVVAFSPDRASMSRYLNIWFKPEEVGGGLHQYLRYDRVHLWGVPNPEEKKGLFIHIRFKNGDEIVEPSTMNKPLVTYLNHGVNDFVAVGNGTVVRIPHIPSTRFDSIEIVVKDEEGNEYIAQTQPTAEYLQLWRGNPSGDTWSSIQNSQKETALLFSQQCHLCDDTLVNEVFRKPFYDSTYGTSDIWNWIYIYDSVSFRDNHGKEFRLYNRIGYDQVTTKLYPETISYSNGGKIRRFSLDDPDISDEFACDEWPVIFGKHDIVVRHFATKDDILNARPEADISAERIEYRLPNGRFVEWSDNDRPPYGIVSLRIQIKGKPYTLVAAFLPALETDVPILRSFDDVSIKYRSFGNQELTYQDSILRDGIRLAPTIPIRYGSDDEYYEVDVYRPTLVKEVLLDGSVIQYLEENDKLDLPYIFKDRVILNDFSRSGYQSYECKNLCNIYTAVYLGDVANRNAAKAALNIWAEGNNYLGKLLDDMAPDSLLVCFGRSANQPNWNGQEALVWNYDMNEDPRETDPSDRPSFGIVFQNLSANRDLTCNFPIREDTSPFGFFDIDVSLPKCFDVANNAETYFFLMKPLVDMQQKDIVKSLYEPLVQMRGGTLTEKDIKGLVRFGQEFGFDWRKKNIRLDIK